jgi:hypothetical protein
MATGKTPSESMAGFLGGGAQGQGMFGGLRDFLFGQQQPSVPLGEMRAPMGAGDPATGMGMAVVNDARAIGQSMGLSPDLTDALAAAAAGMVARGTDPIVAISTVMSDAMQFGPMAGGGLTTQQSTPTPNLDALNQAIMQRTSTMEQVGPQQTGGGYAPSDFGGYGGGTAGETGAPGESSYGLDR